MKTIIKKTTGTLKTQKFYSDDLYCWYDFESDQHGEILIPAGVITNLYQKKIMSIDEAEIARKVIEFAKNYDIIDDEEERDDYNWNIYAVGGEITIRGGYLLKKIVMNEEEYLEYLSKITQSGIASYIELSIND